MTEKAKQLGNQPASSEMYFRQNGEASEYCPFEVQTYSGLTKREYFAGLAMNGMSLSTYPDDNETSAVGKAAIKYTDALLEELSKTE